MIYFLSNSFIEIYKYMSLYQIAYVILADFGYPV